MLANHRKQREEVSVERRKNSLVEFEELNISDAINYSSFSDEDNVDEDSLKKIT